jgi:hypothetical protein
VLIGVKDGFGYRTGRLNCEHGGAMVEACDSLEKSESEFAVDESLGGHVVVESLYIRRPGRQCLTAESCRS